MVANRWAALLACVASTFLLTIVMVRDQVSINLVNGWTIALGLIAAVVLWGRTDASSSFVACAVLLAGMLPAMFGGLGLLYAPALMVGLHAALKADDFTPRGP